MKCLFASTTYKPIRRRAFRAWFFDQFPTYRRTGVFRSFVVDKGQLYAAEGTGSNPEYIVFTHIGPVNASFYFPTG